MGSLSVTSLREKLATLRPDELAEVDQLIAGLPPASFRSFVNHVSPHGFQWLRHVEVLADAMERVASGDLKRLMVFMPPQRGKSWTISRLGTAYYLRRHPTEFVGLASYGASLAEDHSYHARMYYGASGTISEDRAGLQHWYTAEGGGMWAVGVRGGATGKPMRLGVIDDPFRDAVDSASELLQQRTRDWYDSVFTQRLHKGGAIILVQTRWNENDLAGWLLQRERSNPEHWHIVVFPHLYEPGFPWDWPSTCTVSADWRTVEDEVLCPELDDQSDLLRERAVNPYVWAALHQQHPQPREGGMFQRQWFDIVPSAPLEGDTVRCWDCAATQDGGDFTAGVKLHRTPKGEYYILDVVTGRWDSGRRDKIIRQTAEADGLAVKQRREQEPGSAGKDAGLAFVRLLEGYSASYVPATGDKAVRADPFASQCQAKRVKLVRGPWNDHLLNELTAFPTGAHDDQVDACSMAFAMLSKRKLVGEFNPSVASDPNPWRMQ